MRFFDFSLKFNGFDIKKAQSFLSEIQTKNDTDFENYVFKKRSAIVSHHLQNNSFYKSFGKTIQLNDWNSVPIMTKNHLQQPLENRFSHGYSAKNTYVNKTSGSSGHPFIFAKDKWCHAMTWAEIMNRFSWYDIDFNRSLQARFYGIPLDTIGYYKERLKDCLSHRYRFSVFDLSDTAFDRYLKKFESTPFHYINGYTSAIVQFAKYLNQKNIILKDISPSLKVCIVTSEMLFEDDKLLMETQFGIPVVNEYGASELDLIAFQNLSGEWQVNSETLYVEILDDNNRILPFGKEGRIVITSLFNKAHPFIRYDIGDLGSFSDNSTIKKPILHKLIGRKNDMVILPSGKKAAGLTFYYITKSVIENDGNVSEFVITQNTIDSFKISYVSQSELSVKHKNEIIEEVQNYLEPHIKVTFDKVDQLQRSRSGKLKQFSSYIKQ